MPEGLISVTVTGDRQLLAKFNGMSEAVAAALTKKMYWVVNLIEQRVKQKLSGEVLKVGLNKQGHTGSQLRSSISSKVRAEAAAVTGTVFSSGDVRYAKIHEYGGQIPAHLILPKRSKVLSFMMGGEQRYAAYVNHPGAKMPERSYMRSSLRELSQDISLGLKEAAIEAIRRKA